MPPARFTRIVPAVALLGLPALFPACASDDGEHGPRSEELGKVSAELTKDERIARYKKIKAAASSRGLNNKAFLLAGIAYAETSLAHCWSEATWACKGPNSADCGGGPVIAGAGDGPCSIKQGGLGMFQFDAGTFDQTLAKYSADVLTIAGNVSHAIDYTINMVKVSAYTTNAETNEKALAWLNNFDYGNATLRDQWIKTVTHYYNGCKPSYSCWSQRYKHYNDSLGYVVNETGLDFWKSVSPDWAGSFVSQSFPYASQPFSLKPGEAKAGFIEMRNDGKAAWKPGEVFLGTTQPRDVDSKLAAPDWVSPHRAATVDKETPPGQTARFNFSVQGPATLGDHPQFFGLVREGVAWFSDSGQGGPPDDQLQIKVTVVAAPCPDGVGAEWVCQGQDRVRCEPSTGAVSKEACPGGCDAQAGGAVCAPAGAGGAGGQGSAGAGTSGQTGQAGKPSGGSAGQTGQAGKPGAAGAGGSASSGQAGQAGKGTAGQSAKGGQGGSEGESQEGGVTVNQLAAEDDGGCSASGRRGPGVGAGLLGLLGLLGARRRRR